MTGRRNVRTNVNTNRGATADWGVEYYPTSYILDANGVIRYKDLRGAQLEEKVAELMAELN